MFRTPSVRASQAAALSGLALVILFSLVDLHRARQVADSEQALERQTLAAQRGDAPAIDPGPALSASAPARAQVHRALYLARFSQTAALPGVRTRALADATAAIAIAIAHRPHWGEAWTVRAFIGSLCGCEPAAVTAKTLERSYADAPFLRGAAAWRVASGLGMWRLLSPAGRRFVVDEGVWSTRSDVDSRDALFAAFRGSPAYQQFFLRWRQFRAADADLRGDRVAAP